MGISRLFDILENYQQKFSDKEDALVSKVNGQWVKHSTKQYIDLARFVSLGLLAKGYKKGDKIATLSNNRSEWNIFDMGVSQAGIIQVPVYPTISAEDHEFILTHSEAKAIVVSDKLIYNKLKSVINKIDSIKEVFTFSEVEGVANWTEIIELGKVNADKLSNELNQIKSSIAPDDLASIIYTSGTTGSPKGVMLSHRNMLSNALATAEMLPLNSNQRSLSFLPLCHVYERMMNYNFQINGLGIYYAENIGTIADNIVDIKPHVFNTVPRLLESVYDKIIAKGKDLPFIKKKIFFWAVNLGLKFELKGANGWWYNYQLEIADKLIFSKWRQALGNNIVLIVSGGSSLQARLQRVFWAAKLPIYEGYGLTETSPVIAVNDPTTLDNIKLGTVGPVLKGVELKLADDGEILCKGPGVMLGYYKDPETTKTVIDSDGWFHTSDIAVLIDNKFVKITDRKKEIFKTSSGKYIAPQVIENIFKESSLIEQIMVVGDNEKYASALISPNFNYLHFWAIKHKVHFRDNNALIHMPEVIARYQKEVNKLNKRLGQVEQIKRFRLVLEEWSPLTGELSPTLKLKRKVLYKKYEPILREIYSYSPDEQNRAIKS